MGEKKEVGCSAEVGCEGVFDPSCGRMSTQCTIMSLCSCEGVEHTKLRRERMKQIGRVCCKDSRDDRYYMLSVICKICNTDLSALTGESLSPYAHMYTPDLQELPSPRMVFITTSRRKEAALPYGIG